MSAGLIMSAGVALVFCSMLVTNIARDNADAPFMSARQVLLIVSLLLVGLAAAFTGAILLFIGALK